LVALVGKQLVQLGLDESYSIHFFNSAGLATLLAAQRSSDA
jgi:hypothetical protein